jgi:hypothetical protein
MGWRLRVDFEHDGSVLLNQMTTRPVEVFAKPYLGHILFLLSGKEKELIKQLAKQMVPLDAATGTALAFVIVSDEARLSVNIPSWQKRDREKKEFTVDLAALDAGRARYSGRHRGLESLVRSGKLGTVFTDDEIVAVNYAAHEIGRHLGVSSKIPCVVVFDGLSDGEFDTVPLTEVVIDGLVEICRRFTDAALPKGEFGLFKEKQKSLMLKCDVAKRSDQSREEIETSTAEFRSNLARLEEHLGDLQSKLRELMLSGARKADFAKVFAVSKDALSSSTVILKPSPWPWRDYLSEYEAALLSSHAEVVRLHKTVRAIESTLQEELDGATLAERFDGISGYLRKISPDLMSERPVDSPRAAKRILTAVKKAQSARIDEILEVKKRLEELPLLKAKLTEKTDAWYANALQVNDASREKNDLAVEEELDGFRKFSQVSFRRFFRTEARRLGWKAQAGTVSKSLWKSYFKHWLRPENITRAMKAWIEATM